MRDYLHERSSAAVGVPGKKFRSGKIQICSWSSSILNHSPVLILKVTSVQDCHDFVPHDPSSVAAKPAETSVRAYTVYIYTMYIMFTDNATVPFRII